MWYYKRIHKLSGINEYILEKILEKRLSWQSDKRRCIKLTDRGHIFRHGNFLKGRTNFERDYKRKTFWKIPLQITIYTINTIEDQKYNSYHEIKRKVSNRDG